MKKGQDGHKKANYPIIREELRAHCKKCLRLGLVENTLQLVMKNWEKNPKPFSKTIGCKIYTPASWQLNNQN